MNTWYVDNKYNIDYIFNNVLQFINAHNIQLIIDIRTLYGSFIKLAYKTSHKPYKRPIYTYYNIRSRHIHTNCSEYELNMGGYLFDLIHELTQDIQEYDSDFLSRLQNHSIQIFFENACIINSSNHFQSSKDDYNTFDETEYIDY
jgi:hypothetical protein